MAKPPGRETSLERRWKNQDLPCLVCKAVSPNFEDAESNWFLFSRSRVEAMAIRLEAIAIRVEASRFLFSSVFSYNNLKTATRGSGTQFGQHERHNCSLRHKRMTGAIKRVKDGKGLDATTRSPHSFSSLRLCPCYLLSPVVLPSGVHQGNSMELSLKPVIRGS